MKRFLCIIMVLTLVLGCISQTAGGRADWNEEDYEYDVLDDGTVEITLYSGMAEQVRVPSELGGRKVTSIGDQAFAYCGTMTSLILPDTIVRISDDAFFSCTALKMASIPAGVTSIGEYAFASCSALESLVIPGSVSVIAPRSFDCCTALQRVVIGDGVTAIGDNAFSACGQLADVELPDSLTSIGQSAFAGCVTLREMILPKGLTEIGSSAFYSCKSLAAVTVPRSVDSMGENAFAGCPENMTVFAPAGSAALQYCRQSGVSCEEAADEIFASAGAAASYLQRVLATPTPVPTPTQAPIIEAAGVQVSAPASGTNAQTVVYTINTHADATCEIIRYTGDVEELEIPAMLNGYRVTALPRAYHFNGLRRLSIPDSVTYIGGEGWTVEQGEMLSMDWSGMTVSAPIDSYAARFCREYGVYMDTPLDSVAPVERNKRWSVYTYDVYPDGSCLITGYRGSFEQLEIPAVIETHPVVGIGSGAFSGKGMTSVSLPDSVAFVAADAFTGCGNLRQVKVSADHPAFEIRDGMLCRRDDGQSVIRNASAVNTAARGNTAPHNPGGAMTQKPTQKPAATPAPTPTPTAECETNAPSARGDEDDMIERVTPTPVVTATPTPTPTRECPELPGGLPR